MDILFAALLLGYFPEVRDRVTARIDCPWCAGDCWLALAWDRFICNRCGESGNAEQLLRFAPSNPSEPPLEPSEVGQPRRPGDTPASG